MSYLSNIVKVESLQFSSLSIQRVSDTVILSSLHANTIASKIEHWWARVKSETPVGSQKVPITNFNDNIEAQPVTQGK